MNSSPSQPNFIYHLFPLGSLNVPDHHAPRRSLSELSQWFSHWEAMGIDTILLGPVFASESHGYDTTDPRTVDPRLGTNADLAGFVAQAHNRGMKVLLDGVFNHTGRSFWAFNELTAQKGTGEFASWYKEVNPGQPGPGGSVFSYRGWNGHGSLPELNLQNPSVRDYLLETVKGWMTEFAIDGLRLDAADVLDFGFMAHLADFCKVLKPDFWLLGEVIHGDYNRWVDDAKLDSVTNYELYKGLWSSLNDGNFYELTWTLGRHFGPQGLCRNFSPMSFLDNHDVSRLASVIKNPGHLGLLWELIFLLPGIPSVYYGSEWDWTGIKGQGSDWNLRPPCFPGQMYGSPSRVELLGSLARFRRDHSALVSGSFELVANTHRQLCFIRRSQEETLMVAVNALESPVDWNPGVNLKNAQRIWGGDVVKTGEVSLKMGPSSLAVFRV